MRLEGKNALVTGAGAGIGRAIATRFAREGAQVVVSDIDEAAGEVVAESIRQAGGVAHSIRADVRDEGDVRELTAKTAEKLGGLHVVVNNAGIDLIKSLVELTEEDWDAVFSVNVKGVFFGCKHAIPLMSGGGSIINIASVAASHGIPLLSVYCASKGAVTAFTRAMAQEYKAASVRFNTICPMVVDTAMGKNAVETFKTDYGIPFWEILEARQGRMVTVEEVADAAVFLASDESGFVNGHELVLDNGAASG